MHIASFVMIVQFLHYYNFFYMVTIFLCILVYSQCPNLDGTWLYIIELLNGVVDAICELSGHGLIKEGSGTCT